MKKQVNMIKTVIVDDDIEVLDWLEQIIPWEEHGFTIVARARNGAEALDICKTQMPDLIITDIIMPSISGLELVSEIKKTNPGIKSIVLTCHEDFNFAQKAVKLEADDYIVKYTLTSQGMVESLERIKSKLVAESMQQETIDLLKMELSSNRIVIEEKFITDIIDRVLVKTDDIKRKVEVLKLNLPDTPFIVIGNYIDNFERGIECCPIKEEGLFKFCMMNVAEEVMQHERCVKFFCYGKDKLIMLIWDENMLTSIKQRTLFKLNEFHNSVKQILKMNMSSCISSVYSNITDIGSALNETNLMRDSYFFDGSGAIVLRKKCYPKNNFDEFMVLFYKDFTSSLLSGDKSAVMKLMDEVNEKVESQQYSPLTIKKWFSKIIIDLQSAINKDDECFKAVLANMDTFSAIKEGFALMVDSYIENLKSFEHSAYRREIGRVIAYIDTNLDGNISCKSMAELVNLNSSYFSRLFKREVGINFSDYLIRKRINRATELLKKTDMSVEEITKAVGLEQPSYFYKLYKKITDKTPGEVRNER